MTHPESKTVGGTEVATAVNTIFNSLFMLVLKMDLEFCKGAVHHTTGGESTLEAKTWNR